jgi:hypothetical protein
MRQQLGDEVALVSLSRWKHLQLIAWRKRGAQQARPTARRRRSRGQRRASRTIGACRDSGQRDRPLPGLPALLLPLSGSCLTAGITPQLH